MHLKVKFIVPSWQKLKWSSKVVCCVDAVGSSWSGGEWTAITSGRTEHRFISDFRLEWGCGQQCGRRNSFAGPASPSAGASDCTGISYFTFSINISELYLSFHSQPAQQLQPDLCYRLQAANGLLFNGQSCWIQDYQNIAWPWMGKHWEFAAISLVEEGW